MQNPPQKEGEFFENLAIETPIEISVRTTTMAVAKLRNDVLKHVSGELIAESSDTSVARYFKRGCREFKSLQGELKELTEEIIKLGPDRIPALLFKKLGPALQWTLKDIRCYIVAHHGDEGPLNDCKQAFEAYKDNCRPETQEETFTPETFAVYQRGLFKKLELAGFRLAQSIEAVDDRRALEAEKSSGRGRSQSGPDSSTAIGKGHTHFAQIGQEYKGVKVLGRNRLSINGHVMTITAQGNWNFIDRCLKAHFADTPFSVTQAELGNLSTPDEKLLRSLIHRETLEEVGQKRIGNHRYTGRAWFAPA